MSNKLSTLEAAVRRFTYDGMQYASGAALPVGSDAVVFGREMLRQQRRRLHAIFHCNTQQLNLLAAAGAVTVAECGFTGLEGFGFANGLRRAVEAGTMILEDYSNLSLPLRLLGGAFNWPFVPVTSNIGSDLQHLSALAPGEYPARRKIPEVVDPFSGRIVGALSPLRPDLAAIHVTLADVEGNAIMLGTEWSRFELSRAAKKVVLLADHIVDGACIRQYPNLVRIPGLLVQAVVYWPFTSWPQASCGVHDSDDAHMKAMNDALATPEGTARYLEEFVYSWNTRNEFLDLIGRNLIEKLRQGPTAFLLDPYRQWILPEARIDALTPTGALA
jgi:glutaconate CoA-transferase subunit A